MKSYRLRIETTPFARSTGVTSTYCCCFLISPIAGWGVRSADTTPFWQKFSSEGVVVGPKSPP